MATWTPPAIGARASVTRVLPSHDVEAFAALSDAHSPLHFDARVAERTVSCRPVVHGGLTAGLFDALVADQLPGPGSVFLHQKWHYPAAVDIGEVVTAETEVIEARTDKTHHQVALSGLADDAEVLKGKSLVYTIEPADPSSDAQPNPERALPYPTGTDRAKEPGGERGSLPASVDGDSDRD